MDHRKHFFGLKQGLPLLVMSLCYASPTGGATLTPKPKPDVDYNRDIRPILSENCYACHGPDQNKRKAGLRLDIRTNAISELKSGDFAIVPGKPSESKLVERITNKDEDERMPPIKTGKHLTVDQI